MVEFIKSYVETGQLILPPFEDSDLGEWARVIFDDPEVTRHLPKRSISPRENAERNLKAMKEEWNQYGCSWWAVANKLTCRLIGHCGLSYNGVYKGEPELTFALTKNVWGKGS